MYAHTRTHARTRSFTHTLNVFLYPSCFIIVLFSFIYIHCHLIYFFCFVCSHTHTRTHTRTHSFTYSLMHCFHVLYPSCHFFIYFPSFLFINSNPTLTHSLTHTYLPYRIFIFIFLLISVTHKFTPWLHQRLFLEEAEAPSSYLFP